VKPVPPTRPVERRRVLRFDARRGPAEGAAKVSVEELYDLYVNGKHYATALLTPSDLEDWALGFLFSEGIVNSASDVRSVKVGDGRIDVKVAGARPQLKPPILTRLLVSSCGAPVKARRISSYVKKASKEIRGAAVSVARKTVAEISAKLNEASRTYRATRGVHSAALFDASGELLLYSEDVGRHNAVDKVIGKALREGLDMRDKILAVSGRPSGDLVYKCVRARIPIIVALSAPLSSGVEIAEAAGITLIALARGPYFTVYTNPTRVK
jgi:FdhD protein